MPRPLRKQPPFRATFPSPASTATSSTGSTDASEDFPRAPRQSTVLRNHPVSSGYSSYPQLKSDMSGLRVDMAEFKGEIRSDMATMEGRLHAHVNRQAWMTTSVIATLMVVSVGLTGYFVKLLA